MQAILDILEAAYGRGRREPPQLVTAAFPFVPATLGLAHFASTYLPADLLHRTTRFLGGQSALVSATDVHSIQVSTNGRTREGADKICNEYDQIYRKTFSDAAITFDAYLRTDAAEHQIMTHRALSALDDSGHLIFRPCEQLRCADCGAAPPPRLARLPAGDLKCPWCHSESVLNERADHLFLDLEALRSVIERGIKLPDGAARWVAAILREPLVPWCATRDNEVGMSLHRPMPGKSLYLWFESLVGYATLLAEVVPDARRAPLFRLRHFFGKNIIYHHAVLWPAIARGALNIENPIEGHVRGFALNDCSWAEGKLDSPALRAFTLSKVPDSGADFSLLNDEYHRFESKVWHDKFHGMLRRLALKSEPATLDLAVDDRWLESISITLDRLQLSARAGRTWEIAHEVTRFLRFAGSFCYEKDLYRGTSASDRQMAYVVHAVCQAFMQLLAPAPQSAGTLRQLSDSLESNNLRITSLSG